MGRRLLLLAALVLALLLPAGSALAASGTVTHVEATEEGLQVLVTVPAGLEPDLSDVEVTVDGRPAASRAEPAGSAGVRRTAVLAIDTSNSMRGDRFGSAKQAALSFVRNLPDDVYLGIVTFAGEVDAALAPTRDRDAARGVVRSLGLSSRTLLHDGVRAAVEMAGTEGQRSMLVLSDGADTTDTPVETAAAAVEAAGVLVHVVALEQAEEALVGLGRLAEAGSGQVVEAERTALEAAFSAEAAALSRQVLVTAEVPEEVTAPEATVAVSLSAGDEPVVAEVFATLGETTAAAPDLPVVPARDGGESFPDWVLYAGVGTLGLGLVVLLVLLVPAAAPRPVDPADRIARYTRSAAAEPTGGPRADADQALAQAKDAAATVLRRNRSLDERITRRLDAAGSDLKSSEWLLAHAAVFVISGAVGLLLGGGGLVLGLLFLALGAVGPWLYLGVRRTRRRKAFNALLPDTLQLMSGSLSAGLSLAQSVDTIVREGSEPVSTEFRRVLVETRLGVPLEDALEGVAERFESKDFGWVVMAIKIQRQVGGNLGELLDTVAATMREREYLRRQVAALAAEGKLSAWVIGALPPLFMAYLFLSQRDYVIVMFTDPLGVLMLIGAVVLLSVGAFWMSKLVKVEV